MKTTKLLSFALLVAVTTYLASCGNDDEKPQTVPTVVTNETITTTTTTASVSGEITDDGNTTITEAGFVYSSLVSDPTTADNKKTVIDFDELSAELEGLTSGTVYNVRAYAINKKGTAYGEKRTFETGNLAPVVSNVQITGDVEVNKTVTATYTYSDVEGDTEGETTFQWYVANDAAGSGEAVIENATERTFHIEEAQNGKFLRVKVIPVATEGTLVGSEVFSLYIGAVGEATTVTFPYNGQDVTYGIITRPSGKKWMDRNLGATRVAESVSDYMAYGDMFQWGRAADGHQLVTRSGPAAADFLGTNGITSTVAPYETSNSDNAGTIKFIIDGSSIGDWRIPQNDNLWQGVSGVNNPCPTGWRIPTIDEWDAEALASAPDAFSKLKMTYTGMRSKDDGSVFLLGDGIYWSSTTRTRPTALYSRVIDLTETTVSSGSFIYQNRAMGLPCRCIKD